MPLSSELKDSIFQMDMLANEILLQADEEALLRSLFGKLETMKEILSCTSLDELQFYCKQCQGFFEYVKLLDRVIYATLIGCALGLFQ